jgi:hypothetical protein
MAPIRQLRKGTLAVRVADLISKRRDSIDDSGAALEKLVEHRGQRLLGAMSDSFVDCT